MPIAALTHCLSAPPQAHAADAVANTVADWWPAWQPLAAAHPQPFALALRSGFLADRVGWAFAGGYQAALRALVPTLAPDVLAALCVTEETGNRPRDIQTTLAPTDGGGFVLSGAKRWTTLGPQGTRLLVAARLAGGSDERPALRIAQVDPSQPGVTITPMPETRFVPEVPHAQVRFDGVRVAPDALLPGDGYTGCVKPFRTIEDVHVNAAVLAYLLREARARGWPADFRERLTAALTALAAVAAAPADAPANHVALAGALHWAAQLYREAGPLWATHGDDPAAQRWQRDTPLFNVAGAARTQRAASAWARLQGG